MFVLNKSKSRSDSIDRLYTLRSQYASYVDLSQPEKNNTDKSRLVYFSKLAEFAGMSSGNVLFLQFIVGALIGASIGFFINFIAVIIFPVIGAYLPIYFAQKKVVERSKKFSEEYPTILLATASNMKAGLTVYGALERSIMLLPDESEVKKEIKLLLERVSRGIPKDEAVSKFASSIVLPELDLFRRAFNLVLTHGGKFSRTLERLAEVCRERENLISSSKVSTASMRMTGNILMVVAPLIIGVLSIRTNDYWNTLFSHPAAMTMGLIGGLIIVSSCILLRKMSDFKP